jgi:hypothetical protein
MSFIDHSPEAMDGASTRDGVVNGMSSAVFREPAVCALRRNYAAGVEQAYLETLARRQEALRRWRGLAPEWRQG